MSGCRQINIDANTIEHVFEMNDVRAKFMIIPLPVNNHYDRNALVDVDS